MSPIRFLFLLMCLSGCRSSETLLDRGWIGGEYIRVKQKGRGSGFKLNDPLILNRIYPDSPVAESGLVEGDRILSIDGETVRRPWDVHELIEGRDPGQVVPIVIRREGSDLRVEVVVGKEVYRALNEFSVGFELTTGLNIVPWSPQIFGLVSYNNDRNRYQCGSPAAHYYRAEPEARWLQEREGFNFILLQYHVLHEIVSQETAPRAGQ